MKVFVKFTIHILLIHLVLVLSAGYCQAFDMDNLQKMIDDAIANGSENSTVIQNNASVKASSGGNTAEGGEVVAGRSSSEVYSKTVNNGETVEEIYKRSESDSGHASVEASSKIISNNGQNSVETEIYINGERLDQVKAANTAAEEEKQVLVTEIVETVNNNLPAACAIDSNGGCPESENTLPDISKDLNVKSLDDIEQTDAENTDSDNDLKASAANSGPLAFISDVLTAIKAIIFNFFSKIV